MTMLQGEERVAAVVVTWNRRELLERCLKALNSQSHPVAHVFVVDNASIDDTTTCLREHWPAVRVVSLAENQGFGAGLAAGVNAALATDACRIWLFDDDSEPVVDCLGRLLKLSSQHPEVAAFCIDEPSESVTDSENPRLRFCRKALIDGALISRRAIERCGNVRADFFMMMEDYEFLSRLSDSGFPVAAVEAPWMRRLHVGGANNPAWRGYYQARNHLRFAIDRRDPREIAYCLGRQAKRIAHAVITRDKPAARTRLRLKGLVDGLAGRMGRTVEPPRKPT